MNDNDFIKQIGNCSYFVFRPFFAGVFSIGMIFSILSRMFVVTGNSDYILNKKFAYLCASLSSLLAYSIGKLIDKFKELSVERTIKKDTIVSESCIKIDSNFL